MAVAAPNGLPWQRLFSGAARLGAALVTLNPRYREQELRYMLNQSGTRLLLCPATTAELEFAAFFAGLRAEVPTVERYVFLDPPTGDGRFEGAATFDELVAAGAGALAGAPTTNPRAGTGRDDPAVILYTSGTTGRPRGAVLTHGSLLASARAQVAHLGWDEHTSTVGSLPLNHVGGLTCGALSLLVAGGTVVLLPAFSPSSVLAATAEHRTTVLSGVPTTFVMLLQALAANPVDTGSLRQVIVGGSILDPSLARKVAAAWPDAQLVNLYGLSEGSGASVLRPRATTPTRSPAASGSSSATSRDASSTRRAHRWRRGPSGSCSCAARLADSKVPRYVTVVSDVPLTPAGKVAKAELRRRFEAGS